MFPNANFNDHNNSTAKELLLTQSKKELCSVVPMDTDERNSSDGSAGEKPIDTNRRANLKMLLAKFRNQKEFAERTKLVAPHLSQMIRGHRKVGEAVARRIEKELKLRPGYMDEPHDEDSPFVQIEPTEISYTGNASGSGNEEQKGLLNIAQYVAGLTSSVEYKVCEMLIQELHCDHESVRMNIRTFAEYGLNDFDIEVTNGNTRILCDVFVDYPPSSKTHSDRLLSQAMKARFLNAKYCVVYIVGVRHMDGKGGVPSPRVIGTLDHLHKHGFISGSVIVSDAESGKEQIESMFKMVLVR